jgi:hypothetical protein
MPTKVTLAIKPKTNQENACLSPTGKVADMSIPWLRQMPGRMSRDADRNISADAAPESARGAPALAHAGDVYFPVARLGVYSRIARGGPNPPAIAGSTDGGVAMLRKVRLEREDSLYHVIPLYHVIRLMRRQVQRESVWNDSPYLSRIVGGV